MTDDALILRFDDFELDAFGFELRKAGQAIAVEPQVLSMLLLLASNPDRLITKDEIVEAIWGGRIVSEAAIASRIKSARRALGDDGKQQRFIRTVHGRGLRFVGQIDFVRLPRPVRSGAGVADAERSADPKGRPSIAVLPFRLAHERDLHAFLADALADEIIADLARLRWLFVIARGSSFRFRGEDVDCRHVGRALGVTYCLTGSVAFAGNSVVVSAELVDTGTGEVLWGEIWSEAATRVHELRPEIVAQVVSALEMRIASREAELARNLAPDSLSAWSAYHVGLDHMFRFNRADNALAAGMFSRALEEDPDFARAYAGLSFTHFQNAFLKYLPDRGAEADVALELAHQAIGRDRLDPFCQLNLGRSLWLFGDLEGSIEWLDRATTISPNYAQAFYSKAWAETLSGNPKGGESDARLALQLSPLDPLRYAMLATCSLCHVISGRFDEAADWGERAARSPGAHKHIALIAAVATHLAGRSEQAASWTRRARSSDPAITAKDFLISFPFAQSAARETIERALVDLGL